MADLQPAEMALTCAAGTDEPIFIDLTDRDEEGGDGQEKTRHAADGHEGDRHTKSSQNENGYGGNEEHGTTSRHVVSTASSTLGKRRHRSDEQAQNGKNEAAEVAPPSKRLRVEELASDEATSAATSAGLTGGETNPDVEAFVSSYDGERGQTSLPLLMLRVETMFAGGDAQVQQDILQAVSVPHGEAGSALPDGNVTQYRWERFCELFRVDRNRGDTVVYARPDGLCCEIRTAGDWRVLLLAFMVGGVPVGLVTPAREPVRAVFRVRNLERGGGPEADGGSPQGEAAGPLEAPRGLDAAAGAEEDGDGDNCAEDMVDAVDKPDNEPQDPDDPIRLGDSMRDFPEAKAFFNYLPGTKPRFTDGHAHAISGLKMQLRDYQLAAVWRDLHVYGLSGGHATLLADGMGLGKTLEALAAAYLRYLLLMLWDDVRADRRGGEPTRHLRASDAMDKEGDIRYIQPDNAQCPSGTYKHGIPCPCVEKAGSYELVTRGGFTRGPVLVMVPPNLLDQTLDYIGRVFTTEIPVPGAKPIEAWAIANSLPSQDARLPWVTYHNPSHLRARWGTQFTLRQDKPRELQLTPSKELAHVVIVLAASNALNSVQNDSAVSLSVGGDKVQVPFPVQPAAIIYDEMHKTKGADTKPWRFIQALHERATHPVHLIAMSGTPMKKGLSDLESFLRVGSLADYRHWRVLQPQVNAEKARSLFDKAVLLNKWLMGHKDDENYELKAAQYHDACGDLLRSFTIRRLGHQDFGGKQINPLPPARWREIKCLTPASLAADIREVTQQVRIARDEILRQDLERWEANPRRREEDKPNRDTVARKMGKTATHGAFYLLNLLATLPGILPWARGQGCRYELPPGKRTLPTDGPDLDMVTRDSEKMSVIVRVAAEMLQDCTPHEHLPPERAYLPKKMIIFVMSPCLGPTIAAFLCRRFPGVTTTWVGSDMRRSERDRKYAPFKRPTTEFCEEDDDPDDPRILVTTIGIAAEGHNFQRANYCVVVESTRFDADEKQAYARIHRSGQTATVYQYRLFCEDNAAEVTISGRKDKRAELTGDVLLIGPRTDETSQPDREGPPAS